LIAFLVAKYIGLTLTSARALLLAALLGPTSYGVLGTLVLAQQYLSYVALGARDGLTVKLAQAQFDSQRVLLICSSTLFWAWSIGTLILCASFFLVVIVGRGDFNWLWVGVISYLSIINEILANINRDKNKLLRVASNEIVFNAIPLATALIFMGNITVRAVLIAIAGGLFLSILLYARDAGEYRWNMVRKSVTWEVLFAGAQLALMSFVATSLTSVFIFASNAMKLGRTIGLLVFANSLCTIVLYGLNMVAWAATSSSMKSIHATSSAGGGERGTSLRAVFRLGVILCVSSMLILKFVFLFVLRPYAGSEVFAIYMCLLQSYSLLLYKEWNFLAVTSRSLWIAAGYALVLSVVVSTAVASASVSIPVLMQISLALLAFLSLCCVYYCRLMGFKDEDFGAQVAYLCFPLLFGSANTMLGNGGAAVVAFGYSIFWLRTDGRVLLAMRAGVQG
jgi:hypothetical protein